MKNWIKVLIFCFGCTVFIGCDRVTKVIAKENLVYGEPISYMHDTFRLQYVENTGAALSLGDDLPKATSFWLLSIFPLTILLGLFIYVIMHLKKMNRLMALSFCLIIAGGIGNIIDRIFNDRHVSDFMSIGINNIRTGIFNVADICVTAGVIGIFIALNKNKAQQETPQTGTSL